MVGVATPGDTPGNFHSSLANLADRATYFYSASGRYWCDLQANITRRAKDQAERLHPEDVWAEIVRRLSASEKATGAIARVHVCPDDSSDVLDVDEARLVILHPRTTHTKGHKESDAVAAAQKITTSHGSGLRTNRNMLVYLAPDAAAMESLDSIVRDYLGWSYVLEHAADLTTPEIGLGDPSLNGSDVLILIHGEPPVPLGRGAARSSSPEARGGSCRDSPAV